MILSKSDRKPAFSFPLTGYGRKTEVSKAARYPVIEAADSMRTRVALAFIAMVEQAKAQITLHSLEEAIRTGTSNAVFQVLNLRERLEGIAQGKGLAVRENSLLKALKATWEAGARAELEALDKVPVEKAASIGMTMAFDLLNPEAVNFLSNYVMSLIKEVSQETQVAVGEVVREAFQHGGHPFEQAREIRNLVGLTTKQLQAVQNFRTMLETQAFNSALTRELRDKRFDPTLLKAIKNKTKLSQEQINRMVQRYYERSLKYRAEMIARTETIRASHQGQMEVWRQAVQQGLLSKDRKRIWIVTPDDKLCDACRSVRAMNPEGVGLEEQFQSDIGPVSGPPLHPHCRCSNALKVVWRHKQQ